MAGLPPFACPICGRELDARDAASDPSGLVCPRDGYRAVRTQGIWRFPPPAGEERIARFLGCYRAVRHAEDWGSDDPAYYRALPRVPRDDPRVEIWRVRRESFRVFDAGVLRPLEHAAGGEALRVLDLGAGNGWLSRRLACRLGRGLERRHHAVAAVDLDDDPRDGLGAHVHYGSPPLFVPVQASFDHLPWGDGTFDLAVYNGSLHYARDYLVTLREALRVLRPAGTIVILDTPFYRRPESGEEMVREREAGFRARYGSAGVASEAFLTRARLAELGRELGVRWRVYRPFYGWRWLLRPLQNRLLGYREPVRFYVVEGRRRK